MRILLAALFLAGSQLGALGADVSVKDTGAVPDGKTLNTKAIQAAIDQVYKQGGGAVIIPPGTFLTGALFLKPKVNLTIQKDAVLLGSTNIEDFPSMPTRIEGHEQVWRPAVVNASGCDGLQITGGGTLQGGGQPYWTAFYDAIKADKKTKNLDVDRPRNIFIADSNHIVISNIYLRGSGFWNLHLFRCSGVIVKNVDIREPHAPSTDGIDVDSSQHVLIDGCYISDNDDNIALKGSKGPLADQDKGSPAVEDVHIVNCTFGHGNGIVTLGSEATHVKNVLAENCKIEGTESNHVLTIKLRPDTPQHYEDIHVKNIVDNAPGTMINLAPWTQYFDLGGHAPPSQLVENVSISNVTGSTTSFGKIDGPANATVKNLTLENIDLKVSKPGSDIRNIQNLTIKNVKLNGVALEAPSAEPAAPVVPAASASPTP